MMNDRITRHLPGILLICLVLAPGCGGRGFELAPVSGRVTLAGKPLSYVAVCFQPMAENNSRSNPGPGSVGTTDAQGHFILEAVAPRRAGAVVGKHVVRIAPPQPDRGAADSDASFAVNPLPVRSRDGSLQFTIPSEGTDQANFNL